MTADRLRTALRGVRGFVLDADGVLVLNGAPLPGSIEAVRGLTDRGIPFRVVTNFSQFHRASLATWFGASGLEIDPERIITGTSATAAYTRSAYPGRPLFVLAASDARREFDGQHLLTADEADAAPPGTVAAAVIGDAGDELSYRNMDVAFRLVRDGAELLAMHRNPWWLTPKGPTLDAGGFVVGLEFATGRRARVLGKPSPVVFRQAVAGLAADLAERLPRSAFAMVGDDLAGGRGGGQARRPARDPRPVGQDQPSRRRAGDPWRHRPTRARTPGAPDGIAATLADVVAALD